MTDENLSFTNDKSGESKLTEERIVDEEETNLVQRKEDEIIEKIIEQLLKRQSLTKENQTLQQKLAILISGSSDKDFLKLSSSREADESAFRKILDSIKSIEEKSREVSNESLAAINSLKMEIIKKKESLIEQRTSFKEAIEKAALRSVNSETGEVFSAKEVKELLAKEEEVFKTLQEYQLYSIQKRHYLNLALEKKKNLAEGPLDFAGYEMMCIETQNNKEVIQPILEEIKNIKEKAANIINTFSHLSQKLYLAQKEKTKAVNEEKKLETELNAMKNMLYEEKMKYTKMKRENKELQHKFILLQYPRLIEDYNEIQKKNEDARKELRRLKATYEEEMKAMNK